jgi:NDP-sugar pyrophosphorylase family protein
MKKAAILIPVEQYNNKREVQSHLDRLIPPLIDREYKMIYIVLDRWDYTLIRNMMKFREEGVILVTKEFTGDDTGGFLLSLTPLVNTRDKVLSIYSSYIEVDDKLLDMIDLLYPEFRYNIAAVTEAKQKRDERHIYAHLKKNRLVRKFSLKERSDYIFTGLLLLSGRLFKWLEKRIYKRPNLANASFAVTFND